MNQLSMRLNLLEELVDIMVASVEMQQAIKDKDHFILAVAGSRRGITVGAIIFNI